MTKPWLPTITGCVVLSALLAGPIARLAAEGPASSPAAGVYRIYPLLDGHCKIRGDHAFKGGSKDEVYDYALYIWLILGGDKPILVDAGITNVPEMNQGAAAVLYEPITKRPGENARDQLRKFGLTPDDIGHVFITHLHYDHVDDLLTFRNAKIYMGRREWTLASTAAPSWAHVAITEAFRGDPEWKKRLVLLDDQEVFPGFESFWVGGHTPGSTAYRIRTKDGWAVLTGDTVSLLANIERDVPPGVFSSADECMAAMKKIREKADIVLPSHDPGTVKRWPPNPRKAPRYSIRAIKVGECQVRDHITFQGGDFNKTSLFYLYIFVIEGGDRRIVVETGPRDPEGFSKGTAAYIPGGVRQLPEERTPEALRRHGIDPASVSHVIATHLHGDHYDYYDAFPSAKLVLNKREYESANGKLAPAVQAALDRRPGSLQLVEDEEIVPGIRTVRLGCHTEGSQGVLVETHLGPAILTGDVVYKYENIEKDRPTQSPNEQACREAMARIRALADIVVPAHDPLTLQRWPDGVIGALPPEGETRLKVSGLTLVTPPEMSQPLRYAIEQLSELCKASAGFEVKRSDAPGGDGLTVLVGRELGEKHALTMCAGVPWNDLGPQGYTLRICGAPMEIGIPAARPDCGAAVPAARAGETPAPQPGATPAVQEARRPRLRPMILAAGQTDAGTRHAIIELMRRLDLSKLPATLPDGLSLVTKPDFGWRGMYAHQHWAYDYPYALRTWKVEEWNKYVDTLALLHLNLFQIWSMAGSLPTPFSPEDEAWLRRYPPVIDHAKQNHGFEVWIGECANNMVDASRRSEMPPVPQRDYFQFEVLKNPADPAQMEELKAHRAEFYKVCNNADGYWVIDSDPGGWKGSPSKEFVDILMMNRELISKHTKLGPKAKLIYWMWFGWGTGKTPADNWQATLPDLIARNPEPWLMTTAAPEHWKVTDPLNLDHRIVYYPYGTVEPEPSLPFTTIVPDRLRRFMNVPERVGKIPGIMANAQTPVAQWPNIQYFARCAWNMDLRHDPPFEAMYELARWIYPEHAKLLSDAWLSIGDANAPLAEQFADRLETLERDKKLGRPGPIGLKLFPDYGQVARDLAAQLRIHAAAMNFCRNAKDASADDEQLLEQLKKYCLRSLAWRRHTGYSKHGTNGCNFFPVREATHKRWWKDNRLSPQVYAALKSAMEAQFEPWEAELILKPLRE